jgi:hypothetical protein
VVIRRALGARGYRFYRASRKAKHGPCRSIGSLHRKQGTFETSEPLINTFLVAELRV